MKNISIITALLGVFLIISFPSFASKPDNLPKDTCNAPVPLTDIDVYVTIGDPSIDCPAKDCNLRIVVLECNSPNCVNCTGLVTSVAYDPNVSSYHLKGSTSLSYICVRLVDNPIGSCTAGYNSNTCPYAVSGQNYYCTLYVCP